MRLAVALSLVFLLSSANAWADGYKVHEVDLFDIQGGSRKTVLQLKVLSFTRDMTEISGVVEESFSLAGKEEGTPEWKPGEEVTLPLHNRRPPVVKGKWGLLFLYWNGLEPDAKLVGKSVIVLPALRAGNRFELAAATPEMRHKLTLFGPGSRKALDDYGAGPVAGLEADLADRDLLLIAYLALELRGEATDALILRHAQGPAWKRLLRFHFDRIGESRRPAFLEALARHALTKGVALSALFDLFEGTDGGTLLVLQALKVGAEAYTHADIEVATRFANDLCEKAMSAPIEAHLAFLESLSPPLDRGEASQSAVDCIFDCFFATATQRPDATERLKALVAKRLHEWIALLGAGRCDRADRLLGTSKCRDWHNRSPEERNP